MSLKELGFETAHENYSRKKKYQLRGNRVLKDDCFLNSWYDKFRKGSRTQFNEINKFTLVESMFKREEERKLVKMIKSKIDEVVELYGLLFGEFKRSLSDDDWDNLILR